MKNKQKFQSVIITLSDGRCGAFSGDVLVTKKDQNAGVGVANVQFILPKPLPAGYELAKINEVKETARLKEVK